MIFTSAAFETFVRETFTTAREDMDEAMRVIIAEQSLTSLESGQTVKRFSREMIRIGKAAVVRCRDTAGRSRKRRAMLDVLLPQEVHNLALRVNARAATVGLDDSAIEGRFRSDRDFILRDLRPPLPAPSDFWPKAWAVILRNLEKVIVGVLIVVLGAAAVLVLKLSPPSSPPPQTKNPPAAVAEGSGRSGDVVGDQPGVP